MLLQTNTAISFLCFILVLLVTKILCTGDNTTDKNLTLKQELKKEYKKIKNKNELFFKNANGLEENFTKEKFSEFLKVGGDYSKELKKFKKKYYEVLAKNQLSNFSLYTKRYENLLEWLKKSSFVLVDNEKEKERRLAIINDDGTCLKCKYLILTLIFLFILLMIILLVVCFKR